MLQAAWRSRRWGGIIATVAGLPLLAVGFVFWRASHATHEAAAELASSGNYPIQMVPIDRPIPAGVDLIDANPGFQDIALFNGAVVVTARAGLFVYSRTGALTQSYRAGLELPSAELGTMSTGIVAGSAEPELFIATRGAGLLAFNGARSRQVLPANSALTTITAVLALGSGRILLGTEANGLLVFDGRRLSPFHDRLQSGRITALAGADGDLWIGTQVSGVFHHYAGRLDNLAAALPDPQVLSLAVKKGVAFAGTPMGVVEFRNGQRARTLVEGFFAQSLSVLGDALQVGTEDEGILNVPLRARQTPRIRSDPAAEPASVQRLANLGGDSYALTENALYRFEPGRKSWQSVLTASGSLLADRNVASVAVNGGHLWVGYFDRGLDMVEMSLDRATHHEDDALFCVNRIVPDARHQRTAVATANGLVLFDALGRVRQVMGRKDGFLSDHVTDVAFRENGMVVATPAGVSFVDDSGVRSLYAFHGLVSNHVYAVAASDRQTVAGTLGGVSVLEDNRVLVNYTTANSRLRRNWTTALVRVGEDWFAGTYGSGVLRMDRHGEWHSFAELKEGFVVNPNAMVAANGRIYAGSLDRGLFVFDISSGRWTNTNLGLPSLNVTAVTATGGYLYVGTDNGLVRISEGALR